jgi:glutamine phosphoribosylpyrophosphate amidotransferase
MCEIAILDPQRYNTFQMADTAMSVFMAMGDSLGLVAVDEGPERYRYQVFKALEPQQQEVSDWLAANVSDDTQRLLIHGRLATHGAETLDNCHPLRIECDECSGEFVMHNGVIYQNERLREIHEANGHEYQTNVDSETIAHGLGGVPEFGGVHDTPYSHERAFIIGSEKEVYVYTSGVYDLTQDMRMSLGYREFGPQREHDTTTYQEAKMVHHTEAN